MSNEISLSGSLSVQTAVSPSKQKLVATNFS
nr:MAG TPA: hypothetical protein [Caudoviricetes sp.]